MIPVWYDTYMVCARNHSEKLFRKTETMYLSDTLTIGFILVLLISAVGLYFYTALQQTEQKINLLESILLDIKLSHEMKSYSEVPSYSEAPSPLESSSLPAESPYSALEDSEEDLIVSVDSVKEYEELPLEESESASSLESNHNEAPVIVESKVSYDSMTLKELQALAKTRGIGAGTMKKGPLIEALKTSDKVVKPGSTGDSTWSGSFLETSASVSNESV